MFSRETFQKLAKISYILFVVSLFFPIRKVFLFNSAYQTGAYSDFTSFSLYLSDILLFTTCLLIFLPRGEGLRQFYHVVKKPLILIFWLILAYFWHFQDTKSLNLYFLLKYAELIVAYGTTVLIFKEKKFLEYITWLFVAFCSLESFMGLFQFLTQKSIGIKILGESVISPSMLGVAKIVSGGTPYIRGYGTFPHPNLLAAFLVIGILLSFYILSVAKKPLHQILSGLALFINIFGLIITFSRSGFLAAVISILLMGVYLVHKKSPSIKHAIAITLASTSIGLILFFPLLNTRATISDNATLERLQYNQAGLEMIKAHPVFGLGIGESVIHMEQYMHRSLKPWEKQPVHNYFILAGAENGLPGIILLTWLFWLHFQALLGKLKTQATNSRTAVLATGLIVIFILMQFDHYFYTLQQTQMLLWIILGISASVALYNNEGQPFEI